MSHSLAGPSSSCGLRARSSRARSSGSDRVVGISLIAAPRARSHRSRWADRVPGARGCRIRGGRPGHRAADHGGPRVGRAALPARAFRASARGHRTHRAASARIGGRPTPRRRWRRCRPERAAHRSRLSVCCRGIVGATGVERLLRGDAEPARLGIAIAPPRVARRLRGAVGLPERDGLLVRDVEDESVAARAGVQRGDLIVGLGSVEVGSVDALFAALEASTAEPTVLRLVRGVDEMEVPIDLSGARHERDRCAATPR